MADGLAFAREIVSVESAFSSTTLRHAWNEFKETLLFPDFDSDNRPVIRNTARPQEYFSSSEAGMHFRFFRMLPNLFVGIGLLFTFIGLVSALYFATNGIQGADADATQRALRDLLQAATFKFYTSVAGLAGSILLSIVIRTGTRTVDRGFDRLCEALEEKMVRVTPEWIAFQQYSEARDQTRHLKRFNDEVAITVGRYVEDALNKCLPNHLNQAMQPVTDRLAEVTTNLSRMNEDALRNMAEGFGRTMQGAAGDQINKLADVIATMKSSLDGIRDNLDQSGRNLAGALGGSVEQIRTVVATMEGAIDRISTRIEHAVGRGGDALDQQIAAASKVLEDATGKVVGAIDGATRAARERVSDEAAGVAAMLGAAIGQATTESSDKIKSTTADLSQALIRLSDNLGSAIAEMTSQLNGTAAQLGHVEVAIERQRNALIGIAEGAKSTQVAMSGASKAIQEASSPLVSITASIAEASRHTDSSVQVVMSALRSVEEQTRAISSELALTFTNLQRVWSNYEGRFKDVDESLENAFTQLVGQVERNVEVCNGFLAKLDDNLSKTVQRLAGAIDELSELVSSVEKSTAQFVRRVA